MCGNLQAAIPMSPKDAAQYSPLALAFLGDCIYERQVRERILLEANRPARQLHEAAVARVRAAYQAKASEHILPLLTEEEADIFRRGRNATGMSVPKHATPADYRKATGLEALFGYWHLCGCEARIREIFSVIWQEVPLHDSATEANDIQE
ncbi:MAG: Mini-ribonuclease 3 [Oscillospiraceae bacterium]